MTLSNLTMENTISALSPSLSLSVGWGFFQSLSCSRFIFLTLTLSVSFRNSSVDAGLQLLLCGMILSITLMNAELKKCFIINDFFIKRDFSPDQFFV